jgi:hypothetical protein
MKEYYFSLWKNDIACGKVSKWCYENLQEHQWIFSSTAAVMGAPVQIKGNTPTYKLRGDERVHNGIVFYHEMDATAFILAFQIKKHD